MKYFKPIFGTPLVAAFFTATFALQSLATPPDDDPPPDCDPAKDCTCSTSPKMEGKSSRLNLLEGAMEEDYAVVSLGAGQGGDPGQGKRITIDLALAYSSAHATAEATTAANTCLAFGWTHSYNVFLYTYQAAMFRRDQEGRITKFLRVPSTSPVRYKPTAGYFETMIRNADGTFTITYPDGSLQKFKTFSGCPYLFATPIYQMTEQRDRNGNTTTLTYDATGRLGKITDPFGRPITFTYDGWNRIQTITDPLGRTTRLVHAMFGAQLVRIIDPDNKTVDYEYDSLFRIVRKVKKTGDTFLYSYAGGIIKAEYLNPDGTRTFLASVANPSGWQRNPTALVSVTPEYVPSTVTKTDGRGNVWVYSYDKNAYPVTNQAPGQINPSQISYDASTLKRTANVDANGNATYYGNDARGNIIATTNCAGYVTRYTYETNFNQVTSITDPNGFVTTNLYDLHGSRIKETDPLAFTREWTYDAFGNVLTEKDKNGNITHHYYDQFGNRTNTTDALGNVTTFTYDVVGNLLSRTDANLHVRAYAYDSLDRLIAETNGLVDPPPLMLSLPATTPATLNVSTQPDGGVLLQWDGPGMVLTRASNLAGPFEDVLADGAPVTISPFLVPEPLAVACEFYRLRSDAGWFPQSGALQLDLFFADSPPTPRVTTYTYDAEGRRTSVTDANSATTWYAYDERDRLTHTTNALGYVTSVTYDPEGNKLAETDANNRTTWYAYDAQNRLSYITNALGFVTSYAYDPVGNRIAETDANGHTTTVAYDCLNRLVRQTNALGYITQYEYDAGPGGGGCGCGAATRGTSLIAKQTDANGKVTYFKYCPLGRLLTVIRKQTDTADTMDADDAVTSYTYDPNGNRLTTATRITATDYLTNWFGYDALNRPIASTNGAGDVTLTTYDPVGNVHTVAAPNGNVTTNTYDTKDRLIQVDDLIGRVASTAYDAVGNCLSQTDGNNNTVQYAYDALNRLVRTTDAMGNSSTNYYDPVGNLTNVVDRMTNATRYAYDALNRRINTVDALACATAYAYDGVGNLLAITDANNHTTAYEYDALNRKVKEIYPDPPPNTRTFTYDGVGNVTNRTDQKSVMTIYRYSDLYFLLQRDYPTDPDDNFTYDLAGRMLTAEKGGWVVTFTYDAANRVTSTTQGGRVIGYAYNIPARTRTLTYPSGRVITEATDVRERLISVNDGAVPPICTYTYDLGNRVVTRAYRNGVMAGYVYNPNNWITSLNHVVPPVPGRMGILIAGFAYDYDNEGNKVCQADLWKPEWSEACRYDPAYRLTNYARGNLVNCAVPAPDKAQDWLLDCLGNWNVTVTNGVPEFRTHSAANELITINGAPLAYDANGNLVEDSNCRYVWDEENRLTGVTRRADNQVVGDYQYDPLSRRVVKHANPAGIITETRFFYDDWRVLEEQDALDMTQATYVYGPNYLKEALTMYRGGQTFYYHHNALWSPEAVTDYAGTPVERYAYEAYGAVTITDGLGTPVPQNPWGIPRSAIGNPRLFTGQQMDEESGLCYYGYRFYNPDLGRWLSRDPIGELAGVNQYELAGSAPLKHMDSLGLDWWDPRTWPRYGNWGGKGWSGGTSGHEPPVDSSDQCYRGHDQCYDQCSSRKAELQAGCPCRPKSEKDSCLKAIENSFQQSMTRCDRDLHDCLTRLGDNPLTWPKPPPAGQEGAASRFRQGALRLF
jgi:RHS repeat-associated protein